MRTRFAGLRGMSPAARTRFAFTVIAVVVALTATVIVPGYISSRPQFMERYEGVENEYDTWASSVHVSATCQDCHVSPAIVPQTMYAARMLSEFYLSLAAPGREPKLLPAPTDSACLKCHMDVRTVSTSGDLNIPHKAHVSILKMKCIECHNNLVHSAEGESVPPMSGCLTCHDGVTAKRDCSACHTEKEEPLTHRQPTWIIEHPEKVTQECNDCHKWREDWCSDCHKSRKPRSHVKAWRAQHGVAVESRRNCEACHEAKFCIRCHGEVPKLNFDPALKIVR